MSVYFAQAGPYIKVGYSADPMSRMTTVTRSGKRPDDLPHCAETHPLGWIPGDIYREMELHVRFNDRRAAGEWFSLDLDEVRELIWDDPRGVDIQRMSAQAVFAAIKYPDMTRAELAAAGLHIEAVSIAEIFASSHNWLRGA